MTLKGSPLTHLSKASLPISCGEVALISSSDIKMFCKKSGVIISVGQHFFINRIQHPAMPCKRLQLLSSF